MNTTLGHTTREVRRISLLRNRLALAPARSESPFSQHVTRSVGGRKGFTLIETMVAVTVLAIALIGPFAAVETALQASYTARDELVASSLAEEGMEYIRSVRDNNYLNSRPAGFMSGLSGFSCFGPTPTGYCTVDPTQGDVNIFPTAITSYGTIASVPPLVISAAGLYNQQSASPATRFTRSVQMQQITQNEVLVTVLVSWKTSQQSYSVTVVDTLRDWL